MLEHKLAGRRIVVAETRELDLFAELLARRGAEVLRCPLVAILDAPDPAPVLAWLRAFAQGACEDLVLLTGEGLRRLLGCIERNEPGLRAAFVARLAEVRTIVRGPKPARALRELGLKPSLSAPEPTTAGVIACLRELDLRGRCVGVQLYGSEPNLALMDFLGEAGARALPVAPYVYADAVQDGVVLAMIERLAQGAVDAIAFTSKAQVERLFRVAQDGGCLAQLREGLARTVVAAVGPIVREVLVERGVAVQLMPPEGYFLKPLTQQLVDRLGPLS